MGAPAGISQVKVSARAYPQAGYWTKPGLDRSISRGVVLKMSCSVLVGAVGGSILVITQLRKSIVTVVKTIGASSKVVLCVTSMVYTLT